MGNSSQVITPDFTVHVDLEDSPAGTASVYLRSNGLTFVTARFPFADDTRVNPSDRRKLALAAAKAWLEANAAAI